ncbi:Plant-specific transcription factor YABBY family protein [Perilla frutescens var. frutescens]|nr:Plant-specific transcription factor YABBY family protein [Perilla frutescens var. frutescens]
MDLVQPASEHVCYVRCTFCNTVLAVGIPCKRMMDTLTVKCGHCSNLSFLSSKPQPQGHCYDHQTTLHYQAFCNEFKKGQSASSSSSTSSEPSSPKAPFVVKPPEKKHRLPSAYNRFMKEEIQRIKAANPEIPHREAFSAAAKNWARYIPNTPQVSGSSTSLIAWIKTRGKRDQAWYQEKLDEAKWSFSSTAT